jgi:hypothetical protein
MAGNLIKKSLGEESFGEESFGDPPLVLNRSRVAAKILFANILPSCERHIAVCPFMPRSRRYH